MKIAILHLFPCIAPYNRTLVLPFLKDQTTLRTISPPVLWMKWSSGDQDRTLHCQDCSWDSPCTARSCERPGGNTPGIRRAGTDGPPRGWWSISVQGLHLPPTQGELQVFVRPGGSNPHQTWMKWVGLLHDALGFTLRNAWARTIRLLTRGLSPKACYEAFFLRG